MTPAACAFLLWEGPAALGLTIEYALLPPWTVREDARKVLLDIARKRGAAYVAVVLVTAWVILGPILFLCSTVPKVVIFAFFPTEGAFEHWVETFKRKTEEVKRQTEELRVETALKEKQRLDLVTWCHFNKHVASQHPCAICPACGAPWPVAGGATSEGDLRVLKAHPGPNLEPCAGSGDAPTSPTFYPTLQGRQS